jgi:cupin 2 domain-containing protein
MIPKIHHLLSPDNQTNNEIISTLINGNQFRLEHIQSNGDSSPDGFWYDQESDEWVALIEGRATIEFESGSLELTGGDAIVIKAHQKHRVTKTSKDAVWIALHFNTI